MDICSEPCRLPRPRAIDALKTLPRSKLGTHTVELPPIPELAGLSVMALDLGRRTGWAALTPTVEDSGVHELYDLSTGSRPYDDGSRFVALEAFMSELEQRYGGFHVVVFEDVHPGTHKSNRQRQLYLGFRGIAMAWARLRGKAVVPIPVGTIKKCVTGHGNADKDVMIAAVRALGYPTYDDGECDAIGILLTLLCLPELLKQQAVDEALEEQKPKRRRGKKQKDVVLSLTPIDRSITNAPPVMQYTNGDARPMAKTTTRKTPKKQTARTVKKTPAKRGRPRKVA